MGVNVGCEIKWKVSKMSFYVADKEHVSENHHFKLLNPTDWVISENYNWSDWGGSCSKLSRISSVVWTFFNSNRQRCVNKISLNQKHLLDKVTHNQKCCLTASGPSTVQPDVNREVISRIHDDGDSWINTDDFWTSAGCSVKPAV